MTDVTQIPQQIDGGDPSASVDLLPSVDQELRQLAASRLASEKPGQTSQATALVHDAYLRLVCRQVTGIVIQKISNNLSFLGAGQVRYPIHCCLYCPGVVPVIRRKLRTKLLVLLYPSSWAISLTVICGIDNMSQAASKRIRSRSLPQVVHAETRCLFSVAGLASVMNASWSRVGKPRCGNREASKRYRAHRAPSISSASVLA